jgi:hypothetical protein
MANKYGPAGVPVPWDAIKTLWCTGEKSCPELGRMFGVVPNTITTRARREGWHELRDKVEAELAAKAKASAGQKKASLGEEKPSSVMLSSILGKPTIAAPAISDDDLIKRSVNLASSDGFRSRVIAANEKALVVLEKIEVANVGEVDRFAEALTKVERIGARTYGYDRESERPVINVGFLSGGNEYTTG